MFLKIKIICLGKLKEKAFSELEEEYLKRLSSFAKITLIELPEIPYRNESMLEKVKVAEAEIIRKNLPKNSIVILVQEKGILRNSLDFASFIERIGSIGTEIVFVVGSGAGLDDSLKLDSNYQISLSSLTFTHNFARVLLEEQLYRACTIINGKTYHK